MGNETIAMVLLAAMVGAVDASAQTAPRRIVAQVRSTNVLPGYVIVEGETVAAGIFKEIGVSIRWVNDEPVIRLEDLDERLEIEVTGPMALQAPPSLGNSEALGMAITWTNRAYLFGSSLERFARGSHQRPAVVFGRALAHEIGHLLLPGAGHSETGIMRAALPTQAAVDPGFTEEQGTLIRTRLASHRMLYAADGISRRYPLEAH